MLRAYGNHKQLHHLQDLSSHLEICHIPLYVSLLYQHLKAQTFRVVRHTVYIASRDFAQHGISRHEPGIMTGCEHSTHSVYQQYCF